MVSIRSQQLSNMNLQQQLLNLSVYTTQFFNESLQLEGVETEFPFEDTIDMADIDGNFTNLLCPSSTYQNLTYLNVSCDTELKFSVPLYGELEDEQSLWNFKAAFRLAE